MCCTVLEAIKNTNAGIDRMNELYVRKYPILDAQPMRSTGSIIRKEPFMILSFRSSASNTALSRSD